MRPSLAERAAWALGAEAPRPEVGDAVWVYFEWGNDNSKWCRGVVREIRNEFETQVLLDGMNGYFVLRAFKELWPAL